MSSHAVTHTSVPNSHSRFLSLSDRLESSVDEEGCTSQQRDLQAAQQPASTPPVLSSWKWYYSVLVCAAKIVIPELCLTSCHVGRDDRLHRDSDGSFSGKDLGLTCFSSNHNFLSRLRGSCDIYDPSVLCTASAPATNKVTCLVKNQLSRNCRAAWHFRSELLFGVCGGS